MNKQNNILLHTCCAPCMTVPYQRLSEHSMTDIFFYNPNIHPESEYLFRLKEIRQLAERWKVTVHEGSYNKEDWFALTAGFENEPERGARCEICIKLRLRETAKNAKALRYDGFASTLSLSPLKDIDMINRAGQQAAIEFDIPFFPENFKKKDGFRQSVEISTAEGLYRQDYCGCIYSRRR